MEPTQNLDPAFWIGRSQAFGFVANQCSAAQAECIRMIRDTNAYRSLGLTWEQFCDQCLGLHRSRAEAVIRNFEQFGATYFRLAQIARISPDLYSKLAPRIEGEALEISGEQVPIIPENAARIRSAVQGLRAELQKSRDEFQRRLGSTIVSLQMRFDECFHDMRTLAKQQSNDTTLSALCAYATNHLRSISNELPKIPR
jgi:hypothetical protein